MVGAANRIRILERTYHAIEDPVTHHSAGQILSQRPPNPSSTRTTACNQFIIIGIDGGLPDEQPRPKFDSRHDLTFIQKLRVRPEASDIPSTGPVRR